MKRKAVQVVAAATLLAAAVSATMPASAAYRAAPPDGSTGLDLARFDRIDRIGAAQLPTDPYCDHRASVIINLIEEYAEDLALSAFTPEGRHLDLWASDAAGTWTVIYTRKDGVACVVGSGIGWDAGVPAPDYFRQVGLAL